MTPLFIIYLLICWKKSHYERSEALVSVSSTRDPCYCQPIAPDPISGLSLQHIFPIKKANFKLGLNNTGEFLDFKLDDGNKLCIKYYILTFRAIFGPLEVLESR